ncbi:MAG TPA: hypothetical protein DD727_05915 [Clostridiales bacterium]|nr:hypothetical protein [Clostridiales bacterium]
MADPDFKQEIEKNKLILLYILEKIKDPVSGLSFSKLVLERRIMNYFIMQHCISELLEVGFIRDLQHEGSLSYQIAEEGAKFLSFFYSRIPEGMRTSIRNSLVEMQNGIARDSSIRTDFRRHEDGGWVVQCGAYEGGCPLLEIRVLAGSREESGEICRNFKQQINRVYPEIMAILLQSPPKEEENGKSQTARREKP